MYFFGIAIYKKMESGEFKRLQFSQQDKSLFPQNDFKNLEKTMKRLPASLATHGVYRAKVNDEYHYILSRENRHTGENVILAIASRDYFDDKDKELTYLFNNIYHIHIRPEKVNKTLDDMLRNPQGFIGNDLLEGRVSESIAELKQIMLDNIDKVLARGEQIESLKDKAFRLERHALELKKSTSRLKPCCW